MPERPAQDRPGHLQPPGRGHDASGSTPPSSTPSGRARPTAHPEPTSTVDSPYNTRRSAGLPPTPINSPGPGLARGRARTRPTGDWLYYVLTDADGQPLLHRRLRRVPAEAEGRPSRPGLSWLMAAAPGISGAPALAAVIGRPVRHSLSPAILQRRLRGRRPRLGLRRLRGRRRAGAARPLAGMRALGHRRAVGHHAPQGRRGRRRRSPQPTTPRPSARSTAWCRDGDALVGHNTDGAGFVAAAGRRRRRPRRAWPAWCSAPAARPGPWSSRSAAAGAAEVAVVNRTAGPGRAGGGAARRCRPGRRPVGRGRRRSAAADLVVNATSVGMGDPSPGDMPVDPAALHAGQVVADLVYRPLETPFLRAARGAGRHRHQRRPDARAPGRGGLRALDRRDRPGGGHDGIGRPPAGLTDEKVLHHGTPIVPTTRCQ